MQIIKPGLFTVLLIAAILIVGCGKSAYEFKGSTIDPPLSVPDFTLTANTGQPFQLSEDMAGDIALIFFGYTACPDVCPLTLADIRQALDALEPADRQRVQVIFISADPNRDTPELLTRYLNAFDPSFIGLTGDEAVIQTVMKPLGAFGEPEAGTDTNYLVNHTARVYVVTPEGQVPMTYSFGFAPEDLLSDLRHLLAESS